MRAVILCIAITLPVCAGDWPQWRGPARDGQAQAPAQWPEKLTRKWRVEVGEGHSSPVVLGGRVYIFSRENDSETLRSLSLSDGKTNWTISYPVAYTPMGVAAPHGKGPKSTPVVADGRVCTGVTGVLSCHQASDGKLPWRKVFTAGLPAALPALRGRHVTHRLQREAHCSRGRRW
ncbi:MAG: hypothetical protein R2748_26105 [Bryobacterales bacterium]